MKIGTRVLAAVALLVGLASVGLASTTTSSSTSTSTSTTIDVAWHVIENKDCTAINAATGVGTGGTPCCTAASGGTCLQIHNIADEVASEVTFASPYAGAYATGGLAIPVAEWAKIGIATMTHYSCGVAASGRGIRLVPQGFPTNASPPKVKMFNSGGTETTDDSILTNETFTCTIFGR